MDLRRAASLMTSNASRRWQIYSDNRQIIMETFNNVINSGQLVLVDFFATWCQPCKAMRPILEQVKSMLGDRIRIIKVDVDKNRIKE
jgi:thiol-disulfide isomerase/thioredoxin